MKKILSIMMLALMVVGVASCSDDDDNGSAAEQVSNLVATANYGAVDLTWDVPNDSNIYYVQVDYTNPSTGVSKSRKFHRDALTEDSVHGGRIGGFPTTDAVTFNVSTVTYSGAKSAPVTVTCNPLDPSNLKDDVLASIVAESAVEGAQLTWTNNADYTIRIVATFTYRGSDYTVNLDATSTGSGFVGSFLDETTITVYTIDMETGERSASTRSFTIVPSVDPDDIVYDNINYIMFSGSGLHHMTYSYDNPDNKTQIHFETTGNDPYMYCNANPSPVAGYVLKMRYKCNKTVSNELFWVNRGGGAAGGRETRWSMPASNGWTTLKIDFTDAVATHSWAGTTGDFFRFDLGAETGIICDIRNMHWVASMDD